MRQTTTDVWSKTEVETRQKTSRITVDETMEDVEDEPDIFHPGY